MFDYYNQRQVKILSLTEKLCENPNSNDKARLEMYINSKSHYYSI